MNLVKEPKAIMRLFTWLLFITLVATLPTACSLIDSGPDACDGEGVLFQDDFSGDQECGWVQYNQGGAVVSVEEDVLRISTSQPGKIFWSNPGRTFIYS
jgi:hypothetical protein